MDFGARVSCEFASLFPKIPSLSAALSSKISPIEKGMAYAGWVFAVGLAVILFILLPRL